MTKKTGSIYTDALMKDMLDGYASVRDENDSVRREWVKKFGNQHGLTSRQIIAKLATTPAAQYKAYKTVKAKADNDEKKETAKMIAADIVELLGLDSEVLLPLTRTSKAVLVAVREGVKDLQLMNGTSKEKSKVSLSLPPMPASVDDFENDMSGEDMEAVAV